MRVLILVLLFMLYCSEASFSQKNIKGMNVITLNYGGSLYSKGTLGMLEYSKYLYERFSLNSGVVYENGYVTTRESMIFNVLYAKVGNTIPIYTINNKHGFNFYYHVNGGIEYLNSALHKTKSNMFIWGGSMGLQYGVLANSNIGFNAKFEQNYWRRSQIGNWNWVGSVGINFFF
jgi:hypothetical protein